jgi:AcrR family transcriptional regulator
LGTQLGIKDEVAALKRERTIAAAVDLFYSRGYENTTLDAVAERLGVTKPFIYAHFGSKAELLSEICSRGIRSSLDAIASAMSLDASPTEKMRVLGQRFVVSVLENQKHIAIFAREEKNLMPEDFERISSMRRQFDRTLNTLISSGLETGEFKVADPSIAALAIGGLVSWAYVWYRPNGRLELPELASQMSDLILSMVGAGARKAQSRAAH